jgi:hypothetical protein
VQLSNVLHLSAIACLPWAPLLLDFTASDSDKENVGDCCESYASEDERISTTMIGEGFVVDEGYVGLLRLVLASKRAIPS